MKIHSAFLQVKFSFVATDELGASVSSTPCIKMCACKNNGQCVPPPLGDKYNNDSKFIYQGCSCSSGYTGRFCENDIDACAYNGQPCFKGVTCTDLPAPANITGYTCGPCPSGYSGDGENCDGKSRMCILLVTGKPRVDFSSIKPQKLKTSQMENVYPKVNFEKCMQLTCMCS